MAAARPVRCKLATLTFGLLILAPACVDQKQAPPAPSTSARPASTARIAIVDPAPGAVITGPRLKVKVSLEGARILPSATTKLEPDEGHLHLTLDGELQSMSYELEHEVTVAPGPHILQAEFVAGDHAPFSPRVIAVKSIEVR